MMPSHFRIRNVQSIHDPESSIHTGEENLDPGPFSFWPDDTRAPLEANRESEVSGDDPMLCHPWFEQTGQTCASKNLLQSISSEPSLNPTKHPQTDPLDNSRPPASSSAQTSLPRTDSVYESVEDSGYPVQPPSTTISRSLSSMYGLSDKSLSCSTPATSLSSNDLFLKRKFHEGGDSSRPGHLPAPSYSRPATHTRHKHTLEQKHSGRRRMIAYDKGKPFRCSKNRRFESAKQASVHVRGAKVSKSFGSPRVRTNTPLNLPAASLYSCLFAARRHGDITIEPRDHEQKHSEWKHTFIGLWNNKSFAVNVNITAEPTNTAEPVDTTKSSIVAERYRWYQPPSKRLKESSDGKYRCTSGCRWSTMRKADWEAHEKMHYPQFIWLCPYDDCTLKGRNLPAFARRDILVAHVRTCHGETFDPQRADSCRIQIRDSQFPRECIYLLCEQEFDSLQDRLDHIDQYHFSRWDSGPWRLLRPNTAPVSASTPQEPQADLESSSSSTDDDKAASTSSSSSSDAVEDNNPGPASGGGSNRPSFQGSQDHQADFDNHTRDAPDDNEFIDFDRWVNYTFSSHNQKPLSRQYASQGLVLLPILLHHTWEEHPNILLQALRFLRSSVSRTDSLRIELTLIHKILQLSPLVSDSRSQKASVREVQLDSSNSVGVDQKEQRDPRSPTLPMQGSSLGPTVTIDALPLEVQNLKKSRKLIPAVESTRARRSNDDGKPGNTAQAITSQNPMLPTFPLSPPNTTSDQMPTAPIVPIFSQRPATLLGPTALHHQNPRAPRNSSNTLSLSSSRLPTYALVRFLNEHPCDGPWTSDRHWQLEIRHWPVLAPNVQNHSPTYRRVMDAHHQPVRSKTQTPLSTDSVDRIAVHA